MSEANPMVGKLIFEPHNGYGHPAPDGSMFPFGYISTFPTVTPVFELMPILERPREELERCALAMAAGPELLEALKAARAALHQHDVDWDGEPEDAVPLQLARSKCDAAIAKAETSTQSIATAPPA